MNGSGNVSCPGIPQISTQRYTQPNYPGIQQLYGYDAAGGLSATAICVGSMEYCLFMKRSSDSYGRPQSDSFALGAANLYENQPVFSCVSRTYDTMGRPLSVTEGGSGWCPAADAYPTAPYTGAAPWVQNVQYDVADRITSMGLYSGPSMGLYSGPNANLTTESRAWNAMGQMTSVQWNRTASGSDRGIAGGIQYSYSPVQNNGQAQSVDDSLFGESVIYQYDSLKRLTSATATPDVGSSSPAWVQSFQYDGFGNLTAKILNGVNTGIAVDPATNRLVGSPYDDNGNLLAAGGQRVWIGE